MVKKANKHKGKEVKDTRNGEISSTYENVSLKPSYQAFVLWRATLEKVREPKTQEELAEQLGVGMSTLSRWASMPEFRLDVGRKVLEALGHKAPQVLLSWADRLTGESTAADIRLFLEYVNDFKSTLNLESPELKRLADRFDDLAEGKVPFATPPAPGKKR